MSVHASGDGVAWDILETLDVDQPHGLDYRQHYHTAIAIRKRLQKEHVTFADATVGGEHIPGGCAVLDVVDATSDLTGGWNDGTYVGGGLVYTSTKGLLWVCSTLDTTYDGATDVTLLKLDPDLQYAGGDITWQGAHEFDASVDISGSVGMDGDLTVDGTVAAGNLISVGDCSVDGVIKVDGTASQFGGTAGIGLFYDPTVYAGGETSTIGNGLIIKMGDKNVAGTTVDVSFGTAFPNGVVAAYCSNRATTATYSQYCIQNGTLATTGFSVIIDATTNQTGFYWMAIGR